MAVTFVDWQDVPRWGLINKALGLSFHDPIETYHTSEHLYTGVGIPAGTTGRLHSSPNSGPNSAQMESVLPGPPPRLYT